ncbi:hypothetical protein BJX76DRAFT_317231 [Aspergillus varians]
MNSYPGQGFWPADHTTPLFKSQPHVPRNELLLKLEDHHWLYCCGCLKLHPKNYFVKGDISVLPADRYCNYCAHVVDICSAML